MPRALDLTGQTFGRLTVIERKGSDKQRNALWECLCTCGNTTVVAAIELRRGHTKSCGCLKIEMAKTNDWNIKQVKYGNDVRRCQEWPEYGVWKRMRQRCNGIFCAEYARYGGRGIKVCARWNNFQNFLTDMGPRPSKRHSIEREDNDGDYEPTNCRWSTETEQNNNRRNNRVLEYDDKSMTVAQWARYLDINYKVLNARINRFKWSIEKALTTPVKRRS